jgi:hypothetical protein
MRGFGIFNPDFSVASNTNSLQYALLFHKIFHLTLSIKSQFHQSSDEYHLSTSVQRIKSVTIETLSYFSHILFLALLTTSSDFHSGKSANKKSAAE